MEELLPHLLGNFVNEEKKKSVELISRHFNRLIGLKMWNFIFIYKKNRLSSYFCTPCL